MAQKVTYTCDVCGVEKKESNNWWALRSAGRYQDGKLVVRLLTFECLSEPDLFERFEHEYEFHLCGMPCAFKKINILASSFIGKSSTKENQKQHAEVQIGD